MLHRCTMMANRIAKRVVARQICKSLFYTSFSEHNHELSTEQMRSKTVIYCIEMKGFEKKYSCANNYERLYGCCYKRSQCLNQVEDIKYQTKPSAQPTVFRTSYSLLLFWSIVIGNLFFKYVSDPSILVMVSSCAAIFDFISCLTEMRTWQEVTL